MILESSRAKGRFIMCRSLLTACLFSLVLFSVPSLNTLAASALQDTTYLLGGPDRWDGSFETATGEPAWHGWTHADLYSSELVEYWQVSDFDPLAGERSLWCGTVYDNACADGYGNNWRQSLVFSHAVADPDSASTVRLQALFTSDTEPTYDYFHVQVGQGQDWLDITGPFDGVHTATLIDETFTVPPEDYVDGTLRIRFYGESDGGWSDEDCDWDTHGLARVDEITVTVDGQLVSYEDLEDGESQDWKQLALPLVGDFTQLRCGLDDLDPLQENDSWQVTFIDDGIVVPGTGGTPCVNWCYGPDGWVFNVTAGLDGWGVPDGPFWWQGNSGVWNGIISPPLAWPAAATAGQFSFDVYAHMQTYSCGFTSYGWTMRSTTSPDPADLQITDWEPTLWSVLNPETMPEGPGYFRLKQSLDALLPANVQWIQFRLEVIEVGPFCWGPYVQEGTPGPYFDNVAVAAWTDLSDAPPGVNYLALDAHPNPFNPRVRLTWSQPTAGRIVLDLFDARGRRLRRLLDDVRPAGSGHVTWDGSNDAGRPVAAGIYIARLQTDTGSRLCKVTVIR
jgi:hypothetical protein